MREPFQDNLIQFPRLRREPSWSDDPLGIMPYFDYVQYSCEEAIATFLECHVAKFFYNAQLFVERWARNIRGY